MEPVILNGGSCVFVMIDIQEKLLPAMSCKETVLAESLRLLRSAEVLKIPVIATEQYPKGLGATVEQLRRFLNSDMILPKTTFSCWGAEGFEELLLRQNRRQVVIFGIETHICVFSTAMELRRRGCQTVVAESACSSRKREHHELAVRNLLAAGVSVLPAETVIYQLLGRAGTPEFKTLLPLFK